MHQPPPRHTCVAVLAFLTIFILAFQAAHADSDDPVSILYYESIRISETAAPAIGPATMHFDAYGRRFELQQDEAPIVTRTGATRMRGRVTGQPDSWFSLLRRDEELSGIISDDGVTYLVEPLRRVADLLIETPTEDTSGNIIFRLADTLVPQGLLACPTDDAATPGDKRVNGQSALTKLGAELQTVPKTAVTAANALLLIGVVADESFYDEYTDDTESEIETIFAEVESIYSNEIGIELRVDTIFSVTPDMPNPFTDTLIAPDLLDELGNWRFANQTNLGHTHMLTRQRLVNDSGDSLAGISYLGQPGRSGVCNAITGASLSRDIRGLRALIVTHELGHNLGAPHDGDPTGACSSAPSSGLIMSSSVSQTTATEFSDCSVEQIEAVIAAASCLSLAAQVPTSSSALGCLAIPGLFVSLILRRRRRRTEN